MLTLLLASACGAAVAAPAKPDPREARIEQLEQEVQQLVAANQRLQADDQQLAAQTQALAAEVDQLKQGQSVQTQALATENQAIQTVQAKVPPAPSVITTLASGRPIISSADGRFTVTAHAVMQLDSGVYSQAAPGPVASDFRRSGPALGASAANVDLTHARQLKDGTVFRRARVGIDGTAFSDWDYRLILDFGGSGVENTGQLYETWVQYSGFKPLKIRVGAFPPTIGMEDSTSTNTMPFIERSASSDMARGFAAGDTRLSGALLASGDHWLVSGAVTGRTIGVLSTGTAAGVPQTFTDPLAFVGRFAGTPLHGKDWLVQFGVHGSYLERPANGVGPGVTGLTPLNSEVVAFSNTQQLRVDGTKLINTGNIDARHADTVGLEFAVQKSNLLFQTEYESFDVQRSDPGVSSPHFHGYYAEGLWVITGEARKYNSQTAAFDAPPVAHPFSWKDGTWGAWELGVRYADADLNYHAGAAGTAPAADSIRGGEEQNISVGLNWWPNPVVRFMFDYEHVQIDRLSPSAALFQTPVGAQIGQTYDAVGVRSQFAF
ncbi:MAG: porin [Caulobacterales bacterium]